MTLIDLPTAPPRQWRLARIELVNWGTFHGHTRLDIARRGHLITGPSGSGKSSLLDAIATVLTPARWLRFNAAAQENATRNDDRSFMSYVRGAWSREADEFEDKAVSSYLRPRATWSGILLRYEQDAPHPGADSVTPVTLVRLFHVKGASVDRAELKDLAFAWRGDVDLMAFRPFAEQGINARAVKTEWPNAAVTTNGQHKAYFARVARLLDISGENALQLLHRTQSAKNLGTLDHLFRTFMLDTPKTFARADNAVEQFGELSEAHRLVVEAREQLEALRALEPEIARYEQMTDESAAAERLGALLPVFQDRLLLGLVEQERSETTAALARATDAEHAAARALDEASDRERQATARVEENGGIEAERAGDRLEEARRDAKRVADAWHRLASDLESVGLAAPADAAEFAELRHAAAAELAAAGSDHAAPHEHDANTDFFSARERMREIDAELEQLKGRRSNLPPNLLVARGRLAEELGIGEQSLPFAGELLEVLPEYAEWTGAIERVLYPLASTLLVRDDYLAGVRRYVDAHHLGARLVFEAIPAVTERPKPTRSPRSLLHRVRVSPGVFAEWLQWRLAGEYDLECVDRADDLNGVERGLTIMGQVKKSARRYEKNDRYRIDDRSKWILGADNEAKIEMLLAGRAEALRRMTSADAELKRLQQQRDARTRRRTVLEQLREREWAEFDRAAADATVRARRAQLDALSTDNPTLAEAIAMQTEARAARDEARAAHSDAIGARARTQHDLDDLDAEAERLTVRVGESTIGADDAAALETRYREGQRRLDRRAVPEIGTRVTRALHDESRRAQQAAVAARSRFEDRVHAFRTRWAAASADLTPSIDDREGYRVLRRQIEARGLPEHEQNFQRLLRDKSRELIGHLHADLREAPKLVKERIDPVNVSLGRSEFDADRFLRIRVKEQRGPEVVAFMHDLRSIVDGSWGDDDLETAERRYLVLERVMTRLGSSETTDRAWRERCLDTRLHVTFQAQEIDRAGRVVNVHDSSAGLSGGQRQKLVIFCLAAALRYQLAPDETSTPGYGTIVLDEAFDKADSKYTRMAMDVFVEFGFHMILATPQKLLTTLEPYVGAVTSVTNPTRRASKIANVVIEEGPAAAADLPIESDRDRAEGAA